MTKRKNWCEFDKETRKIIKSRDKDRCIYCSKKGALQIAHIFLSRASGGRGCKENGVLLCVNCHRILDNPIGNSEKNKKGMIYNYCQNYLIYKENIIVNDDFMNYLKFDKKKYLEEQEQKNSKTIIFEEKKIKQCKYNQKCKNCSEIQKRKNKSSISIYYCLKKKKIVGKNNIACENFERRKK